MYSYGYSYPNNPQGSGLMGRYEAGVRSDGGSFAFPIDTGLASRLEGLGLLNASSLVSSCNAGKESVLYNLIPTPVQSLDRFAVTRSTVKWVLGRNGLLQEIPANTPAFEYNTDGTYRGLLVEPAGTNGIRNNTNVGAVVGTPGTLPTNYGELLNGLTRAVVGTGTENGVEYVDIRLSGTASGVVAELRLETTTGIVAANGQTWTNSAWMKVIAQPSPPLSYRLGIYERTASGTYVANGESSALSVTSVLSRFSYTRTLSGGGTVERVQPNFTAFLTNGATYDFTIRIGLPQMETGSVATSVIKTSGTSLTRTADSVTLTGASSLIGQSATGGTIYTEVDTRDYAPSFQRIIDLAIDTNNRVTLERGTVSNSWRARIRIAGVDVVGLSPTFSSGIVKMAFAYISGSVAVYANGVLVASSTNAFTLPTLTGIGLGCDVAGTTQLNDRIRSVVLFPTRLPNATLAALTQ